MKSAVYCSVTMHQSELRIVIAWPMYNVFVSSIAHTVQDSAPHIIHSVSGLRFSPSAMQFANCQPTSHRRWHLILWLNTFFAFLHSCATDFYRLVLGIREIVDMLLIRLRITSATFLSALWRQHVINGREWIRQMLWVFDCLVGLERWHVSSEIVPRARPGVGLRLSFFSFCFLALDNANHYQYE